ncbi:MAG: P1 family peptidase [Chloroflexi bacterium]|nr:P1 family peptidase [Chloroflexota bacterium]
MTRYPGAITDVAGIQVGHWSDLEHLTGCSVVLAARGAVGGVAVRGFAPGTRETDPLRPGSLVEAVHGVLLTGGSAFGLAAADGVMRYLEERHIGYDAGAALVPIVPGAVLYDLELGSAAHRPDAAAGYAACQAAGNAVAQGNVGAGTGATVGKLYGIRRAMKGGIGTASLSAGRLVVGALVAVNALGDVIDPDTGALLAGVRKLRSEQMADTSALLRTAMVRLAMRMRNTVIGVVATNARLSCAQANNLASSAHDGLARAVRPAHTLYDGDTLFALATGDVKTNALLVNVLAAQAVSNAIVNAILAAEPAGGLPSASSLARGA